MKLTTLIVAASLLTSCGWSREGTRVTSEKRAQLVVGETTKDQAQLLLGRPDLATADGATWVYHYEHLFAISFVILPVAHVDRREESHVELTWNGDVLGNVEHYQWKRSARPAKKKGEPGTYDRQGRRIK